jgi:NAD(P)-dependent dehydrogenase (short-subunit alcohol dehydrogenase family)
MTSKTLVLITGANRGLGYFAAQQLASKGSYHVLLGSRNFDAAKTAVSSLAEDTSVKVNAADFDPLEIDVTSDTSIAKAAKTVESKYGRLDIL